MALPSKYTPSVEELSEARQYLRRRLEAEYSMTYYLRLLMSEAAAKVMEIAFDANTPSSDLRHISDREADEKIEAVLSRLREELEDVVEDVAATEASKEERPALLAYIHQERYGRTLRERIKDYVGKFKVELAVGAAAAFYLGKGLKEAVEAAKDNLSHPYLSPLVREAEKRGADISIPTYGSGRTNSMLTALRNLLKHSVAEVFMHLQWLRAREREAMGFITFRNSSVPCDMCDEYAALPHPMTDPMPPIHLNCVCGVVFIYPDGAPT